MLPPEISTVMQDFIPLCRTLVTGRYAISLGGSYGEGRIFDSRSDLDFGIWHEDPDPLSREKEPIWERIGERTAYWTERGYVLDGPGLSRIDETDRLIRNVMSGVITATERRYRIRAHYN